MDNHKAITRPITQLDARWGEKEKALIGGGGTAGDGGGALKNTQNTSIS